ncbi:MAG: hypothetical protein HGA19_24790, partial [Oscillochloris sp.]|nr:hypothetical protein [Oscillochloris sp.]
MELRDEWQSRIAGPVVVSIASPAEGATVSGNVAVVGTTVAVAGATAGAIYHPVRRCWWRGA